MALKYIAWEASAKVLEKKLSIYKIKPEMDGNNGNNGLYMYMYVKPSTCTL
jgi:hypothetical protein